MRLPEQLRRLGVLAVDWMALYSFVLIINAFWG